MKYMNKVDYDVVYAKYLYSRDPAELVDLALEANKVENLENATVADIGGGAGRLSRECLDRAARKVNLIEPCHSMVGKDLQHFSECNGDGTRRFQHCGYTAVEMLSPHCYCHDTYDYVFSRQAINYWLYSPIVARMVADNMNSDGLFVFNTFNKRPSKHVVPKEYLMGNRKYVEISYVSDFKEHDLPYESWRTEEEEKYLLENNIQWVNHVQVCEGYPAHAHRFLYIPPDIWDDLLSPFFGVTRHRFGKTDIYVCRKI